MRADYHSNDDDPHVLVDIEALHLVSDLGGNPFSVRLTIEPCGCICGVPPRSPVCLLGFLL